MSYIEIDLNLLRSNHPNVHHQVYLIVFIKQFASPPLSKAEIPTCKPKYYKTVHTCLVILILFSLNINIACYKAYSSLFLKIRKGKNVEPSPSHSAQTTTQTGCLLQTEEFGFNPMRGSVHGAVRQVVLFVYHNLLC